MAPAGTRVVIHVKPLARASWDTHGVNGHLWVGRCLCDCFGQIVDRCRKYINRTGSGASAIVLGAMQQYRLF